MKRQMRKGRVFCFLILCFLLLNIKANVVFATSLDEVITEDLQNEVDEENNDRFDKSSPWMKGADDSIYSNSVDATEDIQDIEPEKPGNVEKYFSELIRNSASSLISLLEENLGAGFSKIIYGRVGSGQPNSVNIYGFELKSGNPYGVTASVSYSLMRSMAFIFLGMGFVFLLAKGAWSGQTSQSREQIKSGFYTTAMKFSVLTLMPYLFDVAVYVRDVVLYGLKEVTGQMITGGATLSLANAFLINAERTGRFVDAVMYLGTVVLTLYFAVIYIAIAIDMLICFVSFPILCVMHSKRKDLLGSWMMTVLSNLLTPVIDAILLLIPLLTSLMLSDVIKGIAIVQMIMCMLIIPSRNRIKALLGVQSNERGGLLSAMALMALGRTVAGKAKNAIGRIKDIGSDMQKSRMHKELGEADEEEQKSLLDGYSPSNEVNKGANNDSLNSLQSDPEMERNESDEPELRMGEGLEGDESDESQLRMGEGLEGNSDLNDTEGPRYEAGQSMDEAEDAGLGEDGVSALKSEHSDLGEEPVADDSIENEEDISQPLTRNEALRNLDKAVEQKQEVIDGLRSRKAAYQNEEKRIARQMMDHERGSEEYRALEKKRADMAVNAAETDQKISGHMQNMNQLKRQAKTIKGNETGATPTNFDDAKAEIICKRANINNFEQPEFRRVLNNAQMQQLYKKRAMANAAKGVTSVVGAVAGGTLVGGASVFMQPSTVAMGAAAGAIGGAAIGGGVVGAGISATRGIRSVAQAGSAAAKSYKYVNTAGPASSIDFETAYEQAPMAPVPPVTPEQRQQKIIQEIQNIEPVSSSDGSDTGKSTIIREIEQDSSSAMRQVINSAGNWNSSSALQALKQANVETEKYISAIRETEGISFTPKQERERRIELQTEYLTEEVLKKLNTQSDYDKGTERYNTAKEMIEEKIRVIVEKKNRNLF